MIKKINTEEYGECFALVLENCTSLERLESMRNSLQKISTLCLEQIVDGNPNSPDYAICDLSEFLQAFEFSFEISSASWGLVEKIMFDNGK